MESKSQSNKIETQRNVPANLAEIRSHSEQYFVAKFPTVIRISRQKFREFEFIKNDEHGLDFLESSIEYAIFKNENVKFTKRSLRKHFLKQKEFREKRVFFYFGEPYTSVVYRNSIVQACFEFAIFYSFLRNQKVTITKAKSLFLKITKVSIGLKLKANEKPQSFDDLLHFVLGNASYFDKETLPSDKRGREQKATTPTILRLIQQGRNNGQIADILLDGKLSELKNHYLSEGFNEERSKSLSEKEFKSFRAEEMKRIASTRRNYFPKKKTEKKADDFSGTVK